MPPTISFEQALERAEGAKHVLLGNGFSRACRDDIFSYDALFARANFDQLQTARHAFDALGTTDFEVVIRALRNTSALVGIYLQGNAELADTLNADADGLRDLLARTIAGNHPDRPSDISEAQYAACRRFLARYRRIYTINYDLLLYWALMQSEIEPQIRFDDGFRQPDEGPADYVTWEVQKTETQNVFYLHGALHLFDAGPELQKFTWCNTGTALVEQIREALATNRFPLFVSEGTHESKLERIQHSGFLNRGYRSFASIGGNLFVFGLSFADRDEHILRLIDGGKMSRLFVSLHGDPDSEPNQRIAERAELMRTRRPAERPLEIAYFDADSAHVWG